MNNEEPKQCAECGRYDDEMYYCGKCGDCKECECEVCK